MRRTLLELLTALSALLAVGLAAGWVFSIGTSRILVVDRSEWDLATRSVRFVTVLGFVDGRLGVATRSNDPHAVRPIQVERTFFMQTGVRGTIWPNDESVPIWPLLLACLALPTVQAIRYARRRPGSESIFRRQRRSILSRLYTVGAVATASGFILAVIFGYRSYPYFDRADVRLLPGLAAIQINSSRGSLMFAWTEDGPDRTLAGGKLLYTRSTVPPTRGPLHQAAGLTAEPHRLLGFTLGTDGTTLLHWNVLIVPYWFVLLTAAVMTRLLYGAARRSRAAEQIINHGLCPTCGYDLRASGDRCPECGAPTSTSVVPMT